MCLAMPITSKVEIPPHPMGTEEEGDTQGLRLREDQVLPVSQLSLLLCGGLQRVDPSVSASHSGRPPGPGPSPTKPSSRSARAARSHRAPPGSAAGRAREHPSRQLWVIPEFYCRRRSFPPWLSRTVRGSKALSSSGQPGQALLQLLSRAAVLGHQAPLAQVLAGILQRPGGLQRWTAAPSAVPCAASNSKRTISRAGLGCYSPQENTLGYSRRRHRTSTALSPTIALANYSLKKGTDVLKDQWRQPKYDSSRGERNHPSHGYFE